MPAYTIWQAAEASLTYLHEGWSAFPGPWATTGHLRAWDFTPFTVAVAETGVLYVRNDLLGDTVTLDVTAETDIDTVARAIAVVVPRLH
ncbi:hypothetical protein ABZ725_47430 [Streptomyces sp. NPDC006872]|uniref:hypothetical protein n=1 Tax=Streptomyces sp. NPDC006872 TaxID=3155720 RepID=UPI00340755CE